MKKSFFIYGGKNSLDFNIMIESYPSYTAAEREIQEYQVPGRSGNLVFDTGSYKNVTQEYEVCMKAAPLNTHQIARAAANWLLAPGGYKKLEDSYDPEVYRMAVFSGPAEVENWFAKYGRVTLEFNCMPQRFLKSGDFERELENNGAVFNPGMDALPLIRLTGSGSGTLVVGEYSVRVSSIPAAGLWIDCDTQNAYSETQNENNILTMSNGFPVLPPGSVKIGWSGGIQEVFLTPRWWMI